MNMKSESNKSCIKLPRIMIAAEKSGCGKTTFTCGLLQLLRNRGRQPVSLKCGPDYIDPMFHKKVLGVPSTNLDSFFLDKDGIRRILMERFLDDDSFIKNYSDDYFIGNSSNDYSIGNSSNDYSIGNSSNDYSIGNSSENIWENGSLAGGENNGESSKDCAVIEGVMGIYDGIYVDSEKYSSYEIADFTDTNILLMVNAKGVGRTLISTIKGILTDDKKGLIKGIILNRISEGYYKRLGPAIEHEIRSAGFDAGLVGYLPETEDISIDSRHLGLRLPGEIQDIKTRINRMAELIERCCDVDTIISLMNQSQDIKYWDSETDFIDVENEQTEGVRLAVARDEAFCFYYRENIKAFENAGAEIVYFSPLRDKKLPDGISGILLGGGYPEEYAEELSRNTSMLVSIKNAFDAGLPCIAECGGFMYLHKSLKTREGKAYPMVGAIDAETEYTGHLVRFGYFTVKGCREDVFQSLIGMKGHEFHYFDSTFNGEDCCLEKASTGKKYTAMITDKRRVIGFPHLYYDSSPGFVNEFVEVMKSYIKKVFR